MAIVTSAVGSKVIVKREFSTLEKAETWPATSTARAELQAQRASDLHKNCESWYFHLMAIVTSAMGSKVRTKREFSTVEKAETWPTTLKGREELDCKRTSDLHKNCES